MMAILARLSVQVAILCMDKSVRSNVKTSIQCMVQAGPPPVRTVNGQHMQAISFAKVNSYGQRL